MQVILYTTHCPRCKVLMQKLNAKNIEYVEVADIEEMGKLNISTVPMLKVDDTLMDFTTANKWINGMEIK